MGAEEDGGEERLVSETWEESALRDKRGSRASLGSAGLLGTGAG